MRLLALFFMLLASQVQAASLIWEYDTTKGTVPSTAIVQRSASQAGSFGNVATIPSLPPTYALPATPDNQWYRISNAGGVSNMVQYVAAPPTQPTIDTLTPRVQALETRMTAVESKNGAQDTALASLQPIPGQLSTLSAMVTTSLSALQAKVTAVEAAVAALSAPPVPSGTNLSVTVQSPDVVEITGLSCTSLRTTGTGLKRTVTCLH